LNQPTSHANSDVRAPGQMLPADDDAGRLGRFFLRLDQREIRFIRRVSVNQRRSPKLAAINGFINFLGNGWIYFVAGLLLIYFKGRKSGWVILAASLSIAIAHLFFYPWIKSLLARQRPFDLDPALKPSVNCLDEYSCPSGHMMTAIAFGIPLSYAFPGTLPAIGLFLLTIAWSRLALAHHYPTDLILGGVIGAAVATPITILIFKG
jgi:undecaprenyl-diphosphatase